MMTNIELSDNQPFMDHYMAAMFLPHTDMTLFPEMDAILARLARGRSLVTETRTVAVAGKGGTGKTTLSGLIVRETGRAGASRPSWRSTPIPTPTWVRSWARRPRSAWAGCAKRPSWARVRSRPAGTSRRWIEYKMHEAVAEAEGFDLLVMGRPEGPGCYCYANNLFREYIKTLAKEYPWVVMDNEGGLEHLSRHTTRDVDVMFIVTDPTVRGMRTVERVNGLIDEMGLVVKQRYVVINRVPEGFDPSTR